MKCGVFFPVLEEQEEGERGTSGEMMGSENVAKKQSRCWQADQLWIIHRKTEPRSRPLHDQSSCALPCAFPVEIVDLQVYLDNVSVSYVNPSQVDTCEQYTSKMVSGLKQAYNDSNAISVGKNAGKLTGPLVIIVGVTDANTNTSGAGSNCKTVLLLHAISEQAAVADRTPVPCATQVVPHWVSCW